VCLRVELLREHVAAKADRRSRVHSRKVSTLPRSISVQARSEGDARHGGADQVQQTEVKIDGSECVRVPKDARARSRSWINRAEVFSGGGVRNPATSRPRPKAAA